MVLVLFVHVLVLLLVLRDRLGGWRWAWCWTVLIGGVELVAITELLSPWRLLRPTVLTGAWLGLAIAWLAWGMLRGGLLKRDLKQLLPAVPDAAVDRTMLLSILAIAGASLLVAVIAPPNNWDSLTYHMARVAQWRHHQSVAHYPTHILRQLHQNPLAEYAILHLQILVAGDRLANLVQWGSWVTAMLAASLLARQLGGGTRAQVLAALLVATLPMAVLQATNTQNDLVLGGLLVVMAVFILRLIRPAPLDEPHWPAILGVAVSAGLALLVKGTGYVFIAPWLSLLVGMLLYRLRGRAIGKLVVVAVVVVAINAGHWSRNHTTYGSILGTKVEKGTFHTFAYANDTFSPTAVVSNVIRNLSLHLVGSLVETAEPVQVGVRRVHEWLGIDPDDHRTTWAGANFVLTDDGWDSLDFAGNPLHLLLIIAYGATVLWRPRFEWTVLVAAMALAGFLAFCLYLRWQPWHSRLHTPLFLLLAAPVAIGVAKLRYPVVIWALAAVLICGAVLRVIGNRSHPWQGEASIFDLPRERQYVEGQTHLYFAAYASLVQQQQLETIGLIANNDEPEYLLWVYAPVKCVKHVEVENVSTKLPPDPCEPQRVFVLKLDQNHFGLRRQPTVPVTSP
jgi:hypothetical protein